MYFSFYGPLYVPVYPIQTFYVTTFFPDAISAALLEFARSTKAQQAVVIQFHLTNYHSSGFMDANKGCNMAWINAGLN